MSLFYPAVEITAFLVALWTVLQMDGMVTLISVLFGWWLLALAVIDFRELVLPDELTLPLIPLGLAVIWFFNPGELLQALGGAVAGFLGLWAISVLYERLRGRQGLGFGDVKLMTAAGAWVGISGLPSVLLWGTIGAVVYVLGGKIWGLSVKPQTCIPFGAFLALGLWLTWIYGPVLLFPLDT